MVAVRTKVKILQQFRLGNIMKAKKKLHQYFKGLIKFLGKETFTN